jgi:hypothetical protein
MFREAALPDDPQGAGAVQPPMVYVTTATKWEYKQLARNLAQGAAPTEEELNDLGADGWELTGVLADSPMVYFYFKRLAA